MDTTIGNGLYANKYKLDVRDSGGKFEIWVIDTEGTDSGVTSDLNTMYLWFEGRQSLSGWNFESSKYATIVRIDEAQQMGYLIVSEGDYDFIYFDFENPDRDDNIVKPTSFTNYDNEVSMKIATFDPLATGVTLDQFKQTIDIHNTNYDYTENNDSYAFISDGEFGQTTPISFENINFYSDSGEDRVSMDLYLNYIPNDIHTGDSKTEWTHLNISGHFDFLRDDTTGTYQWEPSANNFTTTLTGVRLNFSQNEIGIDANYEMAEDGVNVVYTPVSYTGHLATLDVPAFIFGTSDDDGIAGWGVNDLLLPRYNPNTLNTGDPFGFEINTGDSDQNVNLLGYSYQYYEPFNLTFNSIESTPTPAGPSYSHIGNTNNSSSTVEVTDTEYAQNTGSVEFIQTQETISIGNNQYNWTRMQIDETSLYVDNGGTNDYDESTLDADGNPTLASTPDDDQTMGVYVNMRDGLASALVPGVNEVTVANAATINQQMIMPSSNVYAETNFSVVTDDKGTADTADDEVIAHEFNVRIGVEDPTLFGQYYSDINSLQIFIEDEGLYNMFPSPDNDQAYLSSEMEVYYQSYVTNGTTASGNQFDTQFYWNGDSNEWPIAMITWKGIDAPESYSNFSGVEHLVSNDLKGLLYTYASSENPIPEEGGFFVEFPLWVYLDNGPVLESDYDPMIHTSEISHLDDPNVVDKVLAYKIWGNDPSTTVDNGDGTYTDLLENNTGTVGSVGWNNQLVETLDAVSITDPMNLPWEVELSSSDDIYIGRDDVDNGDGTYTTTTEGVAFSRGNDDIDMGLGYNYAVFNNNNEISQLEVNLGYWPGDGSSNVTVTMGDGEVYNQRWVGVNEVWGSNSGYNTLIGSDNDPYNMPSDDVGFLKVSEDGGATYETFTAGEFGDNYLVAMGGASYLAGQGGDDTLNAYVSHDYYFDNADLIQMWPGSEMYGGEGNDTLAGGVLNDSLAGGQNPENNYQIDSDDFYNDIGHDFAFIGFDSDNYGTVYAPSASTLKAVSSIMINGEAITIDTSAIADDASMDQLYSAFSDAVNAAINAHLGNTEQLWEYLSVSHDENNVADGFVLKYAQGLDKPEGAQSYAYSGEQVHHGEVMLPSWAPELQSSSGSTILAANMYAKASEFVDGSGDDNDRFVYYRDDHINAENYGSVENGDLYDNANLNAIRGDIISDLDIGQNSLSLRAEEGEGIWFDAGVINHNSVVIDLSYVPEDTVDMIDAYYTADVSLTDVNGDTSTFTLGELNLPTTALYGEQNYELAYTWETFGIQTGSLGNFIGVSTNTEDVWMDKNVDVLRFEWQAIGEKVGSEGDDALTGSNGSNVFAAFGGDDVLNGSGGGDSYQFMYNFGKDKVLEYGDGIDILQIGAARENVWFERLGRRGDELKVTVNDGTHMGTISVGRQYNPYSAMQAVEQIQFGFDGAVSQSQAYIGNGIADAGINVLRNGEDYVSIGNASPASVYLNPHETGGTLSISWRDSWIQNIEEGWNVYGDIVGLEIDYGTHEDHIEIFLGTNEDGSYSENTGTIHSLFSKNDSSSNITVDQNGGHGISVAQSGDTYNFTDIESNTLLFALELEALNVADYTG